ncbi:uncharacterized protein LOC111390940 [Olea europaea var. sylvestris]|uniref:uncharacterized protein LOC111390940 n=1 Tax=Olea europaea var. sylvestris TaxID=158386 RepID=UPI000C1CF188|nr:uncharacterized protein LOC111390940 [Olea europaea var. sylvestris]
MERQEGREQPFSIIHHLQDPNPNQELCPSTEEFSASKDLNFRPQAARVPYNNNMLLRMDQFARNTYNTNETLNKYHLPLSTLPPEFRLQSSSRFAGKHSHQQVTMPFGDLVDLPIVEANTHQTQWSYSTDAYEISNPLRSLGIQGHQNLASGSSGFNHDGGSSFSHYPLMSRQKRKTIWQDDNAPHRSSYHLAQVGNEQGHRYSLYDPKYETIGLHVDPHLRMYAFSNRNTGNDKGNGN